MSTNNSKSTTLVERSHYILIKAANRGHKSKIILLTQTLLNRLMLVSSISKSYSHVSVGAVCSKASYPPCCNLPRV